jgi:hypothetical protein
MPMLQGVVKRVAQYPPVSHYDLTLIDGLGFDRLSHWWRKRGPVIGGNTLEIWEKKRELGLEVMEHAGLRMSTTHAFDNLPAAEKFLRQAEGDWYFKPDGHVPKAMTRKGDTETLLRFLHWARPQLAKVPRFVLQAPAPDGCEIDVAVWFDGKQPVSFEVTIEEKKFMVGDHGPALGCASNIVWEIPESCRLVKLALAPFLDALAASNYVGIAAVNTIITPTLDVYGLEWTMRTGWDSTQASCAIFDESLATQLTEFAQGGLSQFYRPKKAGMTLRLSMPPPWRTPRMTSNKWAFHYRPQYWTTIRFGPRTSRASGMDPSPLAARGSSVLPLRPERTLPPCDPRCSPPRTASTSPTSCTALTPSADWKRL